MWTERASRRERRSPRMRSLPLASGPKESAGPGFPEAASAGAFRGGPVLPRRLENRWRGHLIFGISNALTDQIFRFPNSTVRVDINAGVTKGARSEEHTSELQSRSDIVCRLL